METLEQPKAGFQTETIKGLVILFYKNLLTPSPKQYTIALSLCLALAKRMKEEQFISELEYIRKTSGIGYNLGLLQTIVNRDIMTGQRTTKTFNYGYRTKPVKLGDMIVALDKSIDRILDIFTEICVKHDIDTTFVSPLFQGMSLENKGL